MSPRVALIRHFRKPWHSPDPSGKADAVLAALDAAGYVVVPKEPTKEMKNAAWMHCTIGLEHGWDSTMHDLLKAAMLAAAQEPTS